MLQCLSRPIQKTIAAAATALIGCEVVGVSALGRELEGTAQPNSGIRRIERLVRNPRFEVPVACGGLVGKLIRRGRRTYVCLDWTDQGQYLRLDLSVATGSRSIPVFWKVVAKEDLSKAEISQNRIEEDVLRQFVELLPAGAEVVLLADRGFGRTEFFRFLNSLPLFYVIRIKGDAWIRTPQGTLRLKEQSVPPGQVWDLGRVAYRDTEADEGQGVHVRAVVAFGMAAEEPWRLVTNLSGDVRHVAGAYGRRFECEETFRNQKDLRFGFGLKLVRLTEAVRYERLLVVVAVACLVAFGVGVHAESLGLHRQFQANTRTTRQHNLIGLGCYLFATVRLTVSGLVGSVLGAILSRKIPFDATVNTKPPVAYRSRPPRRKSPSAAATTAAPGPAASPPLPPAGTPEERNKDRMAVSRMLAVG